jgi:chromosome segregation ATPase
VTDSDEKMLSVRVPEELHALVKADKRTNQEVVRAALWREFGGERKAAIDRRIEEKENRISMIERERNERDRELEQQREELEALKDKREAVEGENAEERERMLRKLRQVPDDPDHMLVQEVADQLDMTPEEAITEANDL